MPFRILPPLPAAASTAGKARFGFPRSDVAARCVIIGFAIFLLALLWTALLFQLRHDKAAVLDAARINTANLVRAYAEHVLGTVTAVDQLVIGLKDDYEKNPTTPNLVQRHRPASPVAAAKVMVGIVNEYGHIVSSSMPLPKAALDISDREYFLAHAQRDTGELYVSPPLTGRIFGRQIVALSRRLNKPDGSFAGIAFGSFDLQYLSGFFGDLVISKNSSFTIVGRDMIIRDMIRGSGRNAADIGKSVANSQLTAALARAPNGEYEAAGVLDGVTRLFSYRSLSGYPLVVVASVAETDVLAEFYQRERWLIAVATVLSLIFLGVAGFQLRRLSLRARAEGELRRSRENLAQAQRVAALGSFERDLVSGKTEWSDGMYHVLGYEKGGIQRDYEAVLARVHPADRALFMAARNAGVEGMAVGTMQFRIIRPDGAERIIHRENALIRDDKGHAIRFCGIYQDITESRAAAERERALERQLLHSQKLEALGTLASGIAHDLNNTLVPIMALSKIAARNAAPGSALHANLGTIFAASEQARDLVKRVLAFSSRDQSAKTPANLHEVVAEALTLMRATIPTSIRIDVRIGDVPLIPADASQIHQVVTNLVTNAAQAIGSEHGTITVALSYSALSAGEGAIRLSVADTGKGMDETTRQRIFEPFFTTKNVGQGTGLGLAIVERIVADHGGRIEVTSAPNEGARFDIFFAVPAARAAASAA